MPSKNIERFLQLHESSYLKQQSDHQVKFRKFGTYHTLMRPAYEKMDMNKIKIGDQKRSEQPVLTISYTVQSQKIFGSFCICFVRWPQQTCPWALQYCVTFIFKLKTSFKELIYNNIFDIPFVIDPFLKMESRAYEVFHLWCTNLNL